MNVKDYLQKKRDPQGYSEMRMHELVLEVIAIVEQAKREIDSKIEQVNVEPVDTTTLRTEVENTLKPELLNYILTNLPQESGDNEEPKGYTLTEEDKQAIAAQVVVPIVEKIIEKTDVVHEQPIVTEVVKEVAVADDAEKIAEKLNTTEESVQISVIRGLQKELASIKREVARKDKGGGGGGMGQVQHESTDVSSATTQVTTIYKIAGNGYAIMGAYYQGQLIMRGTHYTVGGDRKTLNLLFTPQDSTVIDIIYVRG